jgi:hypothetical protein
MVHGVSGTVVVDRPWDRTLTTGSVLQHGTQMFATQSMRTLAARARVCEMSATRTVHCSAVQVF